MAPISCRIFGHPPRFRADGNTMRWECARGCADGGGAKTYPSSEHAARFSAAFNRRDADRIGERAPLLGMLPLRLWRMWKHRRTARES